MIIRLIGYTKICNKIMELKYLLIVMISNKKINIIHIGKCGGGTIKKLLKANNLRFKWCHLRKPRIHENNIILIRDPINRLISAFNWKMFVCENWNPNNKIIPRNINKEEIEGYKYWKNINNFSENLYDNNGNINNMALKLIQNSNHLRSNIYWYLDEILPFCNKNNCNLIRYEYYNEDINNILNIDSNNMHNIPYFSVHVYKNNYSKYISDRGKQNLTKFLEKDYNCFHKLRKKNIINEEYYQNILSGKYHL